MPRSEVVVSCTEAPQYLRLVEFMTEVAAHAMESGDEDLDEIVGHCVDDLLKMAGVE